MDSQGVLTPKQPKQNQFPGEAIHHRFIPTEKPRAISEHPAPPTTKLAGEIGFDPVTKLNLPNKDIFVRPVRNTHQRAVSPGVLSPNGVVSIKGEKQIGIAPTLHNEIKTKAATTIRQTIQPKPLPSNPPQKYVTPADLKPPTPVKPPPVQETQISKPPAPDQKEIKRQLDEINRLLFEQIKRKIATEIEKQKLQLQKQVTVKPVATTLVQPTTKPANEVPTKPTLPYLGVGTVKPHKVVPEPETKPKLHLPIIKTASETKQRPEPVKETKKEYQTQINKIEDEIKTLTREVNSLDNTILSIESERNTETLASLERKIEVDQKMLRAISDWRLALNNLINSHTIALKYLKEKTDWLEEKVEHLNRHPDTHESLHRKPKEPAINLTKLKPGLAIDHLEKKLTVTDGHETASDKHPSPAVDNQNTSQEPVKTPIVIGQTSAHLGKPEERTQVDNPVKLAGQIEINPQIKETSTKEPGLDINTNLNVMAISSEKNLKQPLNQNPITLEANLITKEVKPGEVSGAPNLTVIKEVQTPSFETVKNLVKQSLAKEPPQASRESVQAAVEASLAKANLQPSSETVRKLIEEQLKVQQFPTQAIETKIKEELDKFEPKVDQTELKEIVKEELEKQPPKIAPEEVKQAVEEQIKTHVPNTPIESIKQVVEEELKNTPQKPADNSMLEKMIQQAVDKKMGEQKPVYVQNVASTNQPLPPETPIAAISVQPVATTSVAVSTPDQASIEKQILEQAAQEEAAKEAVLKSKEDLRRKAEEEALKKVAELKEKREQPPNTQSTNVTVSPESLKLNFEKIKADLTTIDNEALKNLDQSQRAAMMQKLDTLEKDSSVAKQYDELKAAAERRRINTELQKMFEQVNPPKTQPTPVQTIQQTNATPVEKIESLKVEEKKFQTPADKAKVIAEIKQLEREAQARKAAESSKPVVKAQPAFGKMLPNTPTIPNVINGIVKDNKGLLLSTVVIIVKDKNNEPVRAFKTNKIGQFALSTPLPNGTYTLELEKEGYEFDIIEVDVNGAIMQPIEIKAH